MNLQREPAPATPHASVQQLVSASMDGQPDALDTVLARWATDADVREAWHAYHLSGDVLRSDDLASNPGRDLAFLQGIRERLSHEPVVFAPTPVARAAGAASRRWAVAAAAAGFMMVGGALVVLRGTSERESERASLSSLGGSGGAVPLLVGGPVSHSAASLRPVAVTVGRPASDSAPAAPLPAGAVPLGDPQARVIDGAVIRDPRLDAYLRAHRGHAAPRPGAVTGRFEPVVLDK